MEFLQYFTGICILLSRHSPVRKLSVEHRKVPTLHFIFIIFLPQGTYFHFSGRMLFMSFPGDEKKSGGCLAAGRGFFHINSHGGAEPCPASPYSDINVRDTSLMEALNSNLFKSLRDGGILMDEHEGGCVLFEHKDEVERLLEK